MPGIINKWVIAGIVLGILSIGLIAKGISFNNEMIGLDERLNNELESTKVNYSQCLMKIGETNDVAKAYTNDVLKISKSSGENLDAFQNQMMTFLNTKIIPDLSPDLRKTVQGEIIACRNAYTRKVEYDLKPLYTTYNQNVRVFPNSLFNSFLGFEKKNFVMPKTDEVNKAFETGVDKKLNLE